MDREEASRALADWAIARSESDQTRNFLVLAAIAAGLNKRQIHLITGIARSTINDILKESIMRERALARQQPDEYYMEARDAAMAAAAGLDPRHDRFTGPGGITLSLKRKPALPLRYFVRLQIARSEPGTPGWTLFNFERSGRVALSGNRQVPLNDALLKGHEAWAGRGELEALAVQLKGAIPEGQSESP